MQQMTMPAPCNYQEACRRTVSYTYPTVYHPPQPRIQSMLLYRLLLRVNGDAEFLPCQQAEPQQMGYQATQGWLAVPAPPCCVI